MVSVMDFKYWGGETLNTEAVPCEKCVEIPKTFSDARCSLLCLCLLKLLWQLVA